MSKKILILIIILLIAAAGAFFAYKYGVFTPKPQESAWKSLLVFEIKDDKISDETRQNYQKKFEEAKSKIETNPDDFSSWLNLGLLKKIMKDFEGAEKVWLYAGKIRPNASTPFVNLGELYGYDLNEPQKAEDAYKTAVLNDPNDANIRLGLADIYRYKFQDGNQKFEQTILEALDKFSENANLLGVLASYYKQTNQKEKAILMYERLVKAAPDNQAAKDDLAELKMQN
jgi:cytochrome c-type biogenesis protein CcmH/NrfG